MANKPNTNMFTNVRFANAGTRRGTQHAARSAGYRYSGDDDDEGVGEGLGE